MDVDLGDAGGFQKNRKRWPVIANLSEDFFQRVYSEVIDINIYIYGQFTILTLMALIQ